MRWGFLGVVLATSLLCTSAQAAVVEEFKAEDWDGMAFTSDETGQFTHCSVFAVYRNGSTLFISYEATESWYLSISNDKWALTEGGEYALKVKVDRRGEIDGTGIALATNQIGLPIEADHPFVGQLRRGNQLVFTFQNEDYAFELSNSNKAMNSAQECVRRHVAANTRSPVMSRQAEPEAAPAPEPAPVPAPEEQTATQDTDRPATASGDQQEFGPWVVAATDDGAGNFVNCTAFGVYGDDQLILSYFPDGVWTFGLYRAAWNLDTNQTYYLWYNVDAPADAANVTKRPVEAAEATRIYFEISDLEDIVARMEGGTVLNLQFRGLTGDAENYSYPLDQTPAAFEATRKCVADHTSSAPVSKEGSGTKGATGVETETAQEAPTDQGADTNEPPADQAAGTVEPRRELPQLGMKLIEEFDVPGWKAAAFSLDDGTFTHCAIKAEYQNGATLGVARAASGDFVLAVQHQDWAIESGAWVPISYSWKGATDLSISTEGQAVETNVIMVGLGSGDELTDSVRNAREMTIEAEEKALSFDVSDVGPGIDAIGECAVRHASDSAPSATPPPAAKKAEATPEPETATPEVTASVDTTTADPGAIRTEAAGYTTALLFRAGYPNHVILGSDADVPAEVPGGDAVWQLGEIMGSTRIVDGGTPDEIKSDVGDGLLSQCGGVLTTDVLISDATHSHFTLTCGASSPRLIHYLVLPRDAGGSYVFALLGESDDVATGTIADLVYGKAVGG